MISQTPVHIGVGNTGNVSIRFSEVGFELSHGMMEDNIHFVIPLLPTSSLLFLQDAANT